MRYRHNLLIHIFFAIALVVSLKNSTLSQAAIIGSNVVTLEVRGNWARVGTADQYTGWMLGDALRKLGESGIYGRSGQVVQVEGLFANLYSETDVTSHKPVVTVPFETRLEVVAEGKGNKHAFGCKRGFRCSLAAPQAGRGL